MTADTNADSEPRAAPVGCACLVLLGGLVAVGALVVVVVRLIASNLPDPGPPWDADAVVVTEPSELPQYGFPDETGELIDETDPYEAVRTAHEETEHSSVVAAIRVEPDDVTCEWESASRADLTCFADYQGARTEIGIKIRDLQIPPGGGRVTWTPERESHAVIVAQEGVNRAFWEQLEVAGDLKDDLEVRCDLIPEPTVVEQDLLEDEGYRCYTQSPGQVGTTYRLVYGGGYHFIR